jgi:proteasome lid subunit RPN8/RPN11
VTTVLAAASLARFPEEACGFILRDGTEVIAENVAEDRTRSFVIDEQMVAVWWPTGLIKAVWHSHCYAPAVPSDRDQSQAHPGLECWIYSVLDEQLGIYLPDEQGRLHLLEMRDLS